MLTGAEELPREDPEVVLARSWLGPGSGPGQVKSRSWPGLVRGLMSSAGPGSSGPAVQDLVLEPGPDGRFC